MPKPRCLLSRCLPTLALCWVVFALNAAGQGDRPPEFALEDHEGNLKLRGERFVGIRPGLGYGLTRGEVQNQTSDLQDARLTVYSPNHRGSGQSSNASAFVFELLPGERKTFEFLEYAHESLSGGTQFSLDASGPKTWMSLMAGKGGEAVWQVALASPEPPAPGFLSAKSADWNSIGSEPWHSEPENWPRWDEPSARSTRVRVVAHPARPTPARGELLWTDSDRMPTRIEPYSACQAWMLDRSLVSPGTGALDALESYARMGGTVILTSSDPQDLRFDLPGAEAARKERFVLRRFGESGARSTVRRLGLGFLIDSEAPPLIGAPQRRAVRWTIERLPSFVHPSEETAQQLVAPTMLRGRMQYGVVSALLLIFVVALGPVALRLAPRNRQPARLLWLVPAFAFALTVIVVGYGLIRDGVGFHETSKSLACVDQIAGRVSVAESRTFYSAAFGPRKLEPGARTLVLPQLPRSSSASRRRAREEVFLVEEGEGGGLVLSGDFLPARQRCTHTVLSERTTRQGLEILEASEASVRVRSDFEATLTGLNLVDGQGRAFGLLAPLDPGSEAELVPIEQEVVRLALESVLPYAGHPLGEGLLPGSYTASLSAGPFRDFLGLKPRTSAGEHAVIGVLDLAAFGGDVPGRDDR